MSIRDTALQKKPDILLVLITFSWTAGAALALVGWLCQDRWFYYSTAVFLGNGLVFLLGRRNLRQSESTHSG